MKYRGTERGNVSFVMRASCYSQLIDPFKTHAVDCVRRQGWSIRMLRVTVAINDATSDQ